MYVSKWMTQPVIGIQPEDSLQEAEARMHQYRSVTYQCYGGGPSWASSVIETSSLPFPRLLPR